MSKHNPKEFGCRMAIAFQRGEAKHVTNDLFADRFPYFAIFTAEIRQLIWTAAIENDSKVIEMKHQDFYRLRGKFELPPVELANTRESFKNNKSDHSGLLGACYESREIILGTLQELHLGQGQKVLFNPLKDTIYFGPSSYIPYWELIDPSMPDSSWCSGPSYNCWPSGWVISQSELYADHVATGLHPLLCKKGLANQRSKIVNLAFDAKFWRLSQRIGTAKFMFSKFPAAETIVLGVGDMGEQRIKYDPGQDQFLSPRKLQYIAEKERIHGRSSLSARPWEVCWGEVTFSDDADPADLEFLHTWRSLPFRVAIGNGTNRRMAHITERLKKMTFSTKCARRDGIYYGHPNRTKMGAARARTQVEQPGDSLFTRY